MLLSILALAQLALAPSVQAGARNHTAAPTPEQSAAWGENRSLKILYAGSPGGSRERVFKEFLEQWFDHVGVIGMRDLSVKTAEPYAVVIADWESYYGNDGYAGKNVNVPATLSKDFTKPVIAMTYVSSRIRPGQKLDWL